MNHDVYDADERSAIDGEPPPNGYARRNGAAQQQADDRPWPGDPAQDERETKASLAAGWEPHVVPAPPAWFETAPPPRTWLLRDQRPGGPKPPGLLPLGKVGELVAEGGAGKTMVFCGLAIAVATKTPWLGCFSIAIRGPDGKPVGGRVLLVLGEEDAEEAQRRLYRSRRAMGAPVPPEGSIVVLPLAGIVAAMLEHDQHRNLTVTAFLHWIRGWLVEHGPWHLIAFDPLSRFAGPDAEIDNAAATRFIQTLEGIAALTGATVLVAHHTNKLSRRSGTVDAVAGRGSSALVDGVRWVATLGVERLAFDDAQEQERLGEIVTWSHAKTNYSRRADDLLLRRDLENGGALVPLDQDDLAMVERARGRDEPRERRQAQRERVESETRMREDAALDEILSGPEAPSKIADVRSALRAALGTCSNDRADAAMARRRQRART